MAMLVSTLPPLLVEEDELLPVPELLELDDELEDEELLDEELEEDEELVDEELDDELLELLLDELEELELLPVPPEGTEHSLVPPAIRPPKVVALHTKLPISVL